MKRKLTVDENCQPMYAVLEFSGETEPIGYIRKLSAKELMLLNCGVGEDS